MLWCARDFVCRHGRSGQPIHVWCVFVNLENRAKLINLVNTVNLVNLVSLAFLVSVLPSLPSQVAQACPHANLVSRVKLVNLVNLVNLVGLVNLVNLVIFASAQREATVMRRSVARHRLTNARPSLDPTVDQAVANR